MGYRSAKGAGGDHQWRRLAFGVRNARPLDGLIEGDKPELDGLRSGLRALQALIEEHDGDQG